MRRYKLLPKNTVIKEDNNRWPNNEIPYIISNNYTQTQLKIYIDIT